MLLVLLVIGPLFCNILINDLFLFIETSTLCNYTDDNTMYSCDKNSDIVIGRLRHDFGKSKWFYENRMVINPDKCHFLISRLNKDSWGSNRQ